MSGVDRGITPTRSAALARMFHELNDLVGCIETTIAEIIGEPAHFEAAARPEGSHAFIREVLSARTGRRMYWEGSLSGGPPWIRFNDAATRHESTTPSNRRGGME